MTSVMERSTAEIDKELARMEADEVYHEAIEHLRLIDENIAELLLRRGVVVEHVGIAKRALGLGVYNGARELQVMQNFVSTAEDAGVDRPRAQVTITALVLEARARQKQQDEWAPDIDEEHAQNILESARDEIDAVDTMIATLLGQRVATLAVLRESAPVAGRPAYNGQREKDEVDYVGELMEAGGGNAEWGRRVIMPYTLLQN